MPSKIPLEIALKTLCFLHRRGSISMAAKTYRASKRCPWAKRWAGRVGGSRGFNGIFMGFSWLVGGDWNYG